MAQRDISRTAIYFVETGKAKPSMETLQLIASRTGKPVDFFLEGPDAGVTDEAALLGLERLVAVGDNAGAVAAGEALLLKTADPRVVALAKLQMAAAHVRLGEAVRARALAGQARMHFEASGDRLMTAEALGWEAAGAIVLEDPAALGYAQEALAMARSVKPVPVTTEARLLQILGTAHGLRHEHAKAIAAFEQAVAVGSSFPDLRRMAYIYGNLSLAHQELGNYAEAARYAHRAMAIEETLHDTLSIAVSENNLALLLYRQGDLARAFAHAESSLRRQEALGVEAGRAHVLMTLAELELARGDRETAERHARAALAVAERCGEATNVGEAHVWLARIAEAQGDFATADADFAVAFAKFEAGQATDWLARGHALYADILQARGDLLAANRHLRRALAAVGVTAAATVARSATA